MMKTIIVGSAEDHKQRRQAISDAVSEAIEAVDDVGVFSEDQRYALAEAFKALEKIPT